jgi:hypothetical protein
LGRLPLVGGITVAAVTLLLRAIVFPVEVNSTVELLGFGWTIFGAFMLAALPLALYQRYDIVSPLLVSGASYAVVLALTGQRYADLQTSGAAMSATPSWLTLFLVGWVAPLAVGVLAGVVEHLIR